MKIKFSILIVLLGLILSSCGNQLQIIPRSDLSVTLIDSTKTAPDFNSSQIAISTSVDTSGRVSFGIEAVRFYTFARPGSIAVDIESYTIDYFYAEGTQIETDTGSSMRGNVAVHVPAGWKCPESDPPVLACGVNSSGAVAATGPAVVTNAFFAIDVDIISKLWSADDGIGRSGAYALITIEGTDANGNHFSKKLAPVTILFVNKSS